jgi:hypothetical protein
MVTRRGFLATVGAAAGASAGGVVGFASTAAALPRGEYQPEHVSITFDETILERYQPRLVFEEDAKDKLIGLYGLLATSPEYDTNAAVYWASYTHQEGVSDLDSHRGDHEPIYVFYTDTGEIREVAYSAYHWIKAERYSIETERPRFDVVDPWHHYIATTEKGELVGVSDLTAEFEAWLSNGLDESLEPGSVVNPWSMRSRRDWWRRGTFGLSFARQYANLRYWFGFDAAGRVDL